MLASPTVLLLASSVVVIDRYLCLWELCVQPFFYEKGENWVMTAVPSLNSLPFLMDAQCLILFALFYYRLYLQ